MEVSAEGMTASAQSLPSSPVPFVAIAPCRIVDTRVATSDGFHEPNFADGETRTFDIPASTDCPGLPATSVAYSFNVQYRPLSVLAFITLFPTGTTLPAVSTLTASPAAWVEDAAIVPAGTSGEIDVYCQYAGRVVIDVNGYYAAQSLVSSLNAKTGDLTLAPGSNIAITPSPNTLTIAMTGVAGGTLPGGSTSQTLYSNGSGWLASSALTNNGTNVGVANNLLLPNTASGGTSGVIQLGGNRFLHDYGPSGSYNSFVGDQAGNFSLTGAYNTASGDFDLSSDTTGSGNTATGFDSLSSNTTGNFNTATGSHSLYANTTGLENTAAGAASLFSNTSGGDNTATGAGSLHSNTTAYFNTANGYDALYANTTAGSNTADGALSLQYNTTASGNTAVGTEALNAQSYSNGDTPWDSFNTAVGFQALYLNQPDATFDGIWNTSVGAGALETNTTGAYNTTTGAWSLLFNTTGSSNTASGVYSLASNTTGSANTASGQESLNRNTTGNYNTAVGYRAGFFLTTGAYNIDIGNQGVAAEGNTIRIGDGNQTRAFVGGIRGVTTGNSDAVAVMIDSAGQLGTVSSSLRFKQDVADMGDASSRLMELRPVTFHYKTQPDGPLQYGLIAEEVEQVMPELAVRDATGEVETVAYHELPAMLLNELQKQQAQIQQQQAQIEGLTAKLAASDVLKRSSKP